MPIAHMDGNYFAGEATLRELERNHQIVFRYATPAGEIVDDAEANPNGALANVAGICNRERNVLGLMPHPERASEALMGSTDGLAIFQSLVQSLVAR
jgi:phosphoribosylformylglycinamidine synthase